MSNNLLEDLLERVRDSVMAEVDRNVNFYDEGVCCVCENPIIGNWGKYHPISGNSICFNCIYGLGAFELPHMLEQYSYVEPREDDRYEEMYEE